MAISLVQTVGTNFAAPPTSTITVAVPAGGVAAGDTLIVASIGGDSVTGNNATMAITDARGNSYNVDLHTYNSGTNPEALQIASCFVTTPLQSGDLITMTITVAGSNPYGSLAVYDFAGLLPNTGRLDTYNATINLGGVTTTLDSGAAPSCSQREELLFGNFRGGSTNTYTATGGYNGLSTVLNSGHHGLFSSYLVTTDGAIPDATCTVNSAPSSWFAQVASYKALTAPPFWPHGMAQGV